MAIWSLLLVEPLSATFSNKTSYSSCSEKQKFQSSCSKSKCNKPKNNANNKYVGFIAAKIKEKIHNGCKNTACKINPVTHLVRI